MRLELVQPKKDVSWRHVASGLRKSCPLTESTTEVGYDCFGGQIFFFFCGALEACYLGGRCVGHFT